ncbi:MAG: hypothetical protein NVS2B8_00040 [Vulcanimicrobiaceae bacterium]
MRCSWSSDSALGEFVEGTLSPVRHARVAAHVAECDECAALLAELRVVDALLLAPRLLEPAPNFSFKVMAEIRSMPAAHVPRTRTFAMLATYVVFAWIAIGAFLAFGGASARASLAFLATATARGTSEIAALASAAGRLFGHGWMDVLTAMGALLALDLACVALFVAAFALARRRPAGQP